jgi:hypothetical protein
MNTLRNLYLRGAFGLAMLPASIGLVAVNAPAQAEACATQSLDSAQPTARQHALKQKLVNADVIIHVVRDPGAQPSG